MLEHYRSFVATAPDELGCYALLFTEPESMTRMVAVAAVARRSGRRGADHCPARRFRRTGVEADQPMPYTDWQAFFDASYPHGRRYYWKGTCRELSDEVLNGMVEVGSSPPITWGNVVIEWYKGAMNRVDPAATAFPHRDAEFQIVCIGGWDDEADDVIGTIWTRSVAEATGAGALNGAFLDFNSADAYGPATERVKAATARTWSACAKSSGATTRRTSSGRTTTSCRRSLTRRFAPSTPKGTRPAAAGEGTKDVVLPLLCYRRGAGEGGTPDMPSPLREWCKAAWLG